MQNFISGLGTVDYFVKPLNIYCDNVATVFFSKNDKYSKGTKRMKLKYFTIKKEVHKQTMSIEHISTNLMIIDPLTKWLPLKTFNELVKRMKIIKSSMELCMPKFNQFVIIISSNFLEI